MRPGSFHSPLSSRGEFRIIAETSEIYQGFTRDLVDRPPPSPTREGPRRYLGNNRSPVCQDLNEERTNLDAPYLKAVEMRDSVLMQQITDRKQTLRDIVQTSDLSLAMTLRQLKARRAQELT